MLNTLSIMIIGFISNKLTIRGTEVCLFDYADYNEKILNNISIIFYPKDSPNNCDQVINKFKKRFKSYAYENYSQLDSIVLSENINLMYNIKYDVLKI